MRARIAIFDRLERAFQNDRISTDDLRALLVCEGYRREMGLPPEVFPPGMLAPLDPDEIEDFIEEGRLFALMDGCGN